ncbi:aminoglycoside phosphotransferase family protein [Thiomicrospira sp. ALE5]|uniref:aminoglycoside phosphotransferase family protein n=1 Tax=Thiomicrospira sp. ALE5 TaxID=748650 RepID=UPI0008E74708|nr:aminoglycoside phosphotransferase family protein [Thiomicrospira sp. ALE5]SFR61187.1 Phosphotransferase enzyme family protein [Thiomicrospira sp. ALE5]
MKPNDATPDALIFLLLELQKQVQWLLKGLQNHASESITKSQTRTAYINNFVNQLGSQLTGLPQPLAWAQLGFHGQQASQQLTSLAKLVEKPSTKTESAKLHKSLSKPLKLADNVLQQLIEQLKPSSPNSIKGVTENTSAKTQLQQLEIFSLKLPDSLNDYKLTLCLAQFSAQLSQLTERISQLAEGVHAEPEQWRALQATLAQTEADNLARDAGNLQLETLAHTKSGCVISKVAAEHDPHAPLGVVKQGQRVKIKQEKSQFARWQDYAPGLVPDVYGYHREGEQAALFVEFLDGIRLDHWLTQAKPKGYLASLALVCERLEEVWRNQAITLASKDNPPKLFMQQLQDRLNDVWHVHGNFKKELHQLGSLKGIKLRQLIKQAHKLEAQLQPPQHYFCHGDLNLDNILLRPDNQQIFLVDLHRSGYQDYLQDIAVLMVSHFRLQVYDAEHRQLIGQSMTQLYQFAETFAASQQDAAIHPRLALGLARSFITSTRFVLDETHARAMFDRGRLLLTLLLDYAKTHDPADFRIDTEIFYGPY